jgi:small-conductance mechanosensitive channel
MEELYLKIDRLFVDGLLSGLIAIAVYILLASIIKSILGKIILKQNWKQKILVNKIKNIVFNVLLLIAIFSQFTFTSALSDTLVTGGGIVAIAIGLASQEVASNVVSGMMILFSKPFNIEIIASSFNKES